MTEMTRQTKKLSENCLNRDSLDWQDSRDKSFQSC